MENNVKVSNRFVLIILTVINVILIGGGNGAGAAVKAAGNFLRVFLDFRIA